MSTFPAGHGCKYIPNGHAFAILQVSTFGLVGR